MLRAGAQDSLAVRGAYVDAMADAAGSVGVIVAAVVIATTGWDAIDPIVAAVIGVWILPRAWRLAASALRVLLQVAPAHVDLDAIRGELMRAARASSTCTTSTCGRSRRRWTSPART